MSNRACIIHVGMADYGRATGAAFYVCFVGYLYNTCIGPAQLYFARCYSTQCAPDLCMYHVPFRAAMQKLGNLKICRFYILPHSLLCNDGLFDFFCVLTDRCIDCRYPRLSRYRLCNWKSSLFIDITLCDSNYYIYYCTISLDIINRTINDSFVLLKVDSIVFTRLRIHVL